MVRTAAGSDPAVGALFGGPGRTRTCNQGIHFAPPFPTGVDYLFTHELALEIASGAGRSCLSSRALEPSGSLCTFRRCTAGLAQGCHRSRDRKGSLNSSRPLRGFHREGTVVDESPALTIVLQAQPAAILSDAYMRRNFLRKFRRCMADATSSRAKRVRRVGLKPDLHGAREHLQHDGLRRRAREIFLPASESSAVSCLTTHARRR